MAEADHTHIMENYEEELHFVEQQYDVEICKINSVTLPYILNALGDQLGGQISNTPDLEPLRHAISDAISRYDTRVPWAR